MKKQPEKKDERKCYYPDCLMCYCDDQDHCKYYDLTTDENGKQLLKYIGYFLLALAGISVMACAIINHLFHGCNL